MTEDRTENNQTNESANKNFGGRLSEQQERRKGYGAQRDDRTKKQKNRDYDHCPQGSLATD